VSLKKYLPYFVQTAGVIAPALVARFTFKLFVTPQKIKRPGKEEAFWSKCTLVKTPSGAVCRTIGEGPEVWFVHGWAGRGSQFHILAAAVARSGFKAMLWDGPAHGDTAQVSAENTNAELTKKKNPLQTNMIEFSSWLRQDIESRPNPPLAIVGHSFGGSASVYLCTEGLNVKKLVSIAAPAILYRVFTNFWKMIRLPKRAQKHFIDLARSTTGKDVHQLTADRLKDRTDLQILIIHDESDRDVAFEHANIFKSIRPDLDLFVPKNLGHYRILQSEIVAEKLTSFLQGQ
jgi:pimeloyl-ACP methyl ester carboxylesterase